MRKYPLEKLCRSGAHCPTCRDREGGRRWRESVMRYARVPSGRAYWVCPYGRDWETSSPAPNAALVPPPNPEGIARPERIEAECKRIGDACVACRAKLQAPKEIDDPDLDRIEDCPFAALPACKRRSRIRTGQAVCPLGVWQCGIEPEPAPNRRQSEQRQGVWTGAG